VNPAEIEKALTSKTKGIMPVHLYGQSADMDPILEIAKRRKLYVVEDTAQAHGATYKGKICGTMGDVGVSASIQEKTWAPMEMAGQS
jgi:dTDP-4-amino-4,6-dideoxygalactose transaminase